MVQTKEQKAAKKRAYYQANRGKIRSAARIRNQSGRQAIADRKWREATKNHFRRRWRNKRQNAKKAGVPFDLPLEFFKNMPTHCPQCSTEFAPIGGPRDRSASVERRNPKLGYVLGNCEWLCGACNRRKGDHSWAEMVEFAVAGFLRSVGS